MEERRGKGRRTELQEMMEKEEGRGKEGGNVAEREGMRAEVEDNGEMTT